MRSFRVILIFSLVFALAAISMYAARLPELALLARSGPEAVGTARLVKYWNENLADKMGFRVKQVEESRANYYTKVNNTLLAGAKTPDILVSYSAFTALYARSKMVLDITDYYYDNKMFPYDRNDWLPIAMDLVTFNGRIYGLPTDTNTYLLYYRVDLVKNPPNTWDELFKMAKKFTRRYNPKSPTLYGLAFYGRKEESTPMFWYQIFRSFGGTWWYSDKPAFDSYPAVKALEWVTNVIKEKIVPPDIATYEYMEILGALQTGQVAFAVQWDAAYPTLLSKKQSPLIYNKIKAAPVPGVRLPSGEIRRAQSAHDMILVINAHTQYPKKAFEFIAWATADPVAVKIYGETGLSPSHKSVLKDKDILAASPQLAVKIPALNKWGYAEPKIPDYPEMKDLLATYLSRAWALEMPPTEALKTANQKIYEFLKGKGYYK